MKILTIVGARPQFIKAATVSRAIAEHNRRVTSNSSLVTEIIIHTGQHYDPNMSEVFFKELEIPEPHLNLEIGSGLHGQQTGQMLIKLEEAMLSERPDWVVVYGDTNSTLAGALAAVKLHIPVVHVEAGLRSFNKIMPEEHNRVLTDHCSNLLFCPTHTSVENLSREGISKGVHWVGDVMYDSVLYNLDLSMTRSNIITRLNLKPKNYALATLHRAENTDDIQRLKAIFSALEKIATDNMPVVLPLHPRTHKLFKQANIRPVAVKICEPVPYLDILLLEKNASIIFTDSGGVQKEAFWMKVPCVTLRDETEWIETVELGWNVLVGANIDKIANSIRKANQPKSVPDIFGSGDSAKKIISTLVAIKT